MVAGDIVKFKDETPEEAEARASGKVVMKVVWVDAPRAGVVSEIGGTINPTSVYEIDDLEVLPA